MTRDADAIELSCADCRWSEVCRPETMRTWLARLGMLKRDRDPPAELMRELLRTSAGRLSCPACGRRGLLASDTPKADTDWQQARRCESCGAAIGRERLAHLPTAVLCARCQADVERGVDRLPTAYCPRCGAPMTLRQDSASALTRYKLICTSDPRH